MTSSKLVLADTKEVPTRTLHLIGNTDTFEVMDDDLLKIDESTDEERNAFGLMTALCGSLLGTVLSFIGLPDTAGPMAFGIYAGVTLALFVLSCTFTGSWLVKRRKRRGIMSRIREANRITVVTPIGRTRRR